MKKFKNSFDYVFDPTEHEVNLEPSKTVPDMTMSLEEIIRRYTRGGEVATFTPVFQDGDDFDENPDISKMDAMERLQYASEIKQSIKDYQNRPAPPKTEPKPEAPDPDSKDQDKPDPKDQENKP